MSSYADQAAMGILFGSKPPKGVSFTPLVVYNSKHPMFGGMSIHECANYADSKPTFNDAYECVEETVKFLGEKMKGKVVPLDTDKNSGFHYIIHDPSTNINMVSVGIEMHDTRNQTMM